MRTMFAVSEQVLRYPPTAWVPPYDKKRVSPNWKIHATDLLSSHLIQNHLLYHTPVTWGNGNRYYNFTSHLTNPFPYAAICKVLSYCLTPTDSSLKASYPVLLLLIDFISFNCFKIITTLLSCQCCFSYFLYFYAYLPCC